MQEVFAVMHKDMNLMPRIHVKRPGVVIYTGIPGVGSYTDSPSVEPYTGNPNSGRQRKECPCGLLAASQRTMSQHSKI